MKKLDFESIKEYFEIKDIEKKKEIEARLIEENKGFLVETTKKLLKGRQYISFEELLSYVQAEFILCLRSFDIERYEGDYKKARNRFIQLLYNRIKNMLSKEDRYYKKMEIRDFYEA